jgi:hypothetical protein
MSRRRIRHSLAALCALSCAAACGGRAAEDSKPQGNPSAGAAGAQPSSGGNTADPPASTGGSPSTPYPPAACPITLPQGTECDSANGPPPVCVYPDQTCGTITASCVHNQWQFDACAVAPQPDPAPACAVPYAALPSGVPLEGLYCPDGLQVVFAQPLNAFGGCWDQQVAVSCTAGSSSANACWVDTSTNLLYRLDVDPCMPDPKWRRCSDVEYENSRKPWPNCAYQ